VHQNLSVRCNLHIASSIIDDSLLDCITFETLYRHIDNLSPAIFRVRFVLCFPLRIMYDKFFLVCFFLFLLSIARYLVCGFRLRVCKAVARCFFGFFCLFFLFVFKAVTQETDILNVEQKRIIVENISLQYLCSIYDARLCFSPRIAFVFMTEFTIRLFQSFSYGINLYAFV